MKIFYALTLLLSIGFAAPAHAETAMVMENIYLRAGPNKTYPVVASISKYERVELRGCERDLGWCEIRTIENDYGWVKSSYLNLRRNGRNVTIIESKEDGGVIVTIFEYPEYWNKHYRGKSFYRHHGRYSKEKPSRTPKVKEVKPEPKYKKNIVSGDSTYNPLCRMGQSEC